MTHTMLRCPICDGERTERVGYGETSGIVTCGRCKGTGYIAAEKQPGEGLVFSGGRLIRNDQRPLTGHHHGVNGTWYPCADMNCQWVR